MWAAIVQLILSWIQTVQEHPHNAGIAFGAMLVTGTTATFIQGVLDGIGQEVAKNEAERARKGLPPTKGGAIGKDVKGGKDGKGQKRNWEAGPGAAASSGSGAADPSGKKGGKDAAAQAKEHLAGHPGKGGPQDPRPQDRIRCGTLGVMNIDQQIPEADVLRWASQDPNLCVGMAYLFRKDSTKRIRKVGDKLGVSKDLHLSCLVCGTEVTCTPRYLLEHTLEEDASHAVNWSSLHTRSVSSYTTLSKQEAVEVSRRQELPLHRLCNEVGKNLSEADMWGHVAFLD